MLRRMLERTVSRSIGRAGPTSTSSHRLPIGWFVKNMSRSCIRRNIDGFLAPGGSDDYTGLSGQRAFFADSVSRLAKGETVCDELFVAAGAALACAAVHADWLALAGRVVGLAPLVEAARDVERLAHHWTAVRILSALTRDGAVSADRLRRRADALVADHDRVLAVLDDVLAEL